MGKSQASDSNPNSLEIRSSSSYYKFSNFLNYGKAPVIPKASRNDSEREMVVDIPSLADTKLPSWHGRLEEVWGKARREKLVDNLIVHGSHGDQTSNSYSDLDMTLILDDRIFGSLPQMNKLRKWLRNDLLPAVLSVDPLQHHGPFFLWNNLIDNYLEDILPIAVYQHAWAMDSVKIGFRPLPSDTKGDAAHRSLISLQDSSKFFSRGHTMYDMKRYLSNLMLVPALHWSDLGTPMFKGESFEPFYEKFGSAANPIKVASDLRQKWPTTPEKISKAVQLGSQVKGGLELARQLYHDDSVSKILINEIMPGISDLANSVARV